MSGRNGGIRRRSALKGAQALRIAQSPRSARHVGRAAANAVPSSQAVAASSPAGATRGARPASMPAWCGGRRQRHARRLRAPARYPPRPHRRSSTCSSISTPIASNLPTIRLTCWYRMGRGATRSTSRARPARSNCKNAWAFRRRRGLTVPWRPSSSRTGLQCPVAQFGEQASCLARRQRDAGSPAYPCCAHVHTQIIMILIYNAGNGGSMGWRQGATGGEGGHDG